ncbi:glycoside hydrolase family 75 protein [Burkholderia seminalis]|nr:glycoside hydrolase family 75 protein [Burkholderia seminalis]MDN7586188.1 glycoside hydrolase family 75 protein [Burkholderia seminalis]
MRGYAVVGLAGVVFFGVAAAHAAELRGEAISEEYRAKFRGCDESDRFDGVRLPIKRSGKTVWYACTTDPSRLARLERISASGDAPEAVLFEAKLAHDLDGSPKACTTPGKTDQCGTSLMLKPTQMRPCPAALKKTGDKYCLPVDASNIPYIAVPGFGPRGIDGKAFGKKTNIALGDLGVVIANGKVVPVIVADYGPAYKIGEGSTALLRKLSVSGTPETINAGVKYIVFPGTSMGRNTSADTLADDIRQKAMALYERLGK